MQENKRGHHRFIKWVQSNREKERKKWRTGEEVSGQLASSPCSALLADCLTDGGWQRMLNEVSDTQAVTCTTRKRNTWVTIPQHLESPSYRDMHICQLPHTSPGRCFPHFPRSSLPENNEHKCFCLMQITRSNFQDSVYWARTLHGRCITAFIQ